MKAVEARRREARGGASVAAALTPGSAGRVRRGEREQAQRVGRAARQRGRAVRSPSRGSRRRVRRERGEVQRRPHAVVAGRQLEAHAQAERVAALGRRAVGQVRARAAVGQPHDGVDRARPAAARRVVSSAASGVGVKCRGTRCRARGRGGSPARCSCAAPSRPARSRRAGGRRDPAGGSLIRRSPRRSPAGPESPARRGTRRRA